MAAGSTRLAALMASVTTVVAGDGCCQDCGKYRELRPYGKNSAWVCFKCAMKDEAEAKRQFERVLQADTAVIDTRRHGND